MTHEHEAFLRWCEKERLLLPPPDPKKNEEICKRLNWRHFWDEYPWGEGSRMPRMPDITRFPFAPLLPRPNDDGH